MILLDLKGYSQKIKLFSLPHIQYWILNSIGYLANPREWKWRRQLYPTPVLLPGKSLGERSLADYHPRGHKRVGHHLATKQQQPTRKYYIAQGTLLNVIWQPGWEGGKSGGEWTHVYVWLNPFAVHLKPSQRCESAILQYKI